MSVQTMRRMIDWVDENIKENPTLEKMSDSVGYSPFYCSAKFHEFAGVTFKQYVAGKKLNLAAKDIKASGESILQIALDYGFSSNEAFTRAFVKQYGCTPNQYRKGLCLSE